LSEIDEETRKWTVEVRRELHRNPDLSGEEVGTQEIIQGYLDELDIPHEPIAGTGVIARIEGGTPGRTIALRADTDGLRITETETERNADYISQVHGQMHACGHDGHMAMVLGAARVLAERREEMRGNVVLIFQPHEEAHPGGAPTVIEDGALDGVNAILGFHIMGYIESGIIATKPGPLMAHIRIFEISFTGTSGHHMDPDQCIDPISMTARFVSSIHRDVANALDPTHPFVLGFGQVLGGTQYNQTPDHVFLTGTYRTFDMEDADLIETLIDRNLRSIVEAFTKDPEDELPSVRLRITPGHPVLENDPDLARWAVDVLREEQLVVDPIPRLNFGAEDFAHYCEKVPGLFMFLGTNNPAKGITAVNHSSRFDIDEDVLELGVRAYVALATDFLKED
jgi:amidohydrolase